MDAPRKAALAGGLYHYHCINGRCASKEQGSRERLMAAELSLEKLVEEIKNLRSDLSWASESLFGRARQQTAEAAARVRQAAEGTWSEARDAAATVTDRIEDQPLVATAIAFGVGMLLGMLLTGRRR